MRHKADINKADCYYVTPLIVACKFASLACVKLLLEHNVDIDYEHMPDTPSALFVAVQNPRHIECVELLLEHGASLTSCSGKHVTSETHDSVMLTLLRAAEESMMKYVLK